MQESLLLAENEEAFPRVVMPRSTGEAVAKSENAAVARSRAKRVLLIDDNEDLADLVAVLLSREGHDVRVAYNGCIGIELAKDFQPDVVFLDIGMPGKSGLDVARELRQCLKTQPLLVALTAYGTAADQQRGLEAGFDHYCVKPARASELRALVAAVEID